MCGYFVIGECSQISPTDKLSVHVAFDKIIFVADKIEETRSYPDLNVVRELAYENIDKCVVYIIEFAVKKTRERGEEPHFNSILTLEKLKRKIKSKIFI